MQKGPLFPIFKRSSSIHKNNPALVASIVLRKKSTSTAFVRFLKNTDFTRSCAFAQSQISRVKMLKKKKISRILKLPSWQHCTVAALYVVHYILSPHYK